LQCVGLSGTQSTTRRVTDITRSIYHRNLSGTDPRDSADTPSTKSCVQKYSLK
jgi:hypothetical protein